MSKNQLQSDNKKTAKDGVEGQRKVVGGVISTRYNFVKAHRKFEEIRNKRDATNRQAEGKEMSRKVNRSEIIISSMGIWVTLISGIENRGDCGKMLWLKAPPTP